ncbi:C3a anaphylatoxin chemotactic receptor-like isoform X1 [Gambusia affinis]|uniref:C3a anaphylatoxin chemotactic receptor-like isoform X1 n=2 Tax=Gambusia affinis TaxID=33528 RepID=UPI001CDD2A78|nr:C3a anaphylatoxin chemotactic receptor-like isoform X1 [Gambusia affinis]
MANGNGNSSVSHPTGLEMAAKHIQTFSLVIYCVIIVVGTVGNGLVIYVTGFKMRKTVNSVWFLNLALADFLFTAFLVFTAVSLSQQHHWPFGQSMCKLNNFVSLVNMFASVFFLTAISLDRCLSIWVVVWAQNKRTVDKAQVISALIWLAAGICSTPYAYFRTVEDIQNQTYCKYPSTMTENKQWTLYIFRFVMGFLFPFLAIFFSYVAIGIRARRLQRMRKQRCHRIIFSVIFAFFTCWLPFHVLSFIQLKFHNYSDVQNIVLVAGPLTVSLAFMNSCLNPILYVFMCDEFQKTLKQSIWLVLENALAEDHVSFVTLSRSLSRTPRKSDSTAPAEGKETETSMILTKPKKEICTKKSMNTEENSHKLIEMVDFNKGH